MIEPTDEMVMALWRLLPSEVQEGREPDDIRPWAEAVLAIVERDRCLKPRGHVFHPLAKRDEPLPLAVGRIQAYCGRAQRPHPGHVWITEPGRWCPGVEERP